MKISEAKKVMKLTSRFIWRKEKYCPSHRNILEKVMYKAKDLHLENSKNKILLKLLHLSLSICTELFKVRVFFSASRILSRLQLYSTKSNDSSALVLHLQRFHGSNRLVLRCEWNWYRQEFNDLFLVKQKKKGKYFQLALLFWRPIFIWNLYLTVVTSDIRHTLSSSMVATYSPVGLKSSPLIMDSKEYSKFDASITVDDYSVGSAISTCG